MTTDIEQRALELAEWSFSAPDDDAAKEIATALRQVRNEALEEAAKRADGFLGADVIAEAIRSLKTTEDVG